VFNLDDVVLECRNIVKHYGNVEALNGVSFELRKNEILGLVGDNGAGKSTLLKIIRGAVQPTSGEIFINGKKVEFSSPMDAAEEGIQCVYQDLALVDQMTIVDNFFLGRELREKKLGFIPVLRKKKMENETEQALKQMEFSMDVNKKVSDLSGGQRQAIAVARAVFADPKIVLLDEPTSALSEIAKHEVFKLLKGLKEEHSLIFVTHDLNNTLQLCDRIIILKHGVIEYEGEVTKDLSLEELLSMM